MPLKGKGEVGTERDGANFQRGCSSDTWGRRERRIAQEESQTRYDSEKVLPRPTGPPFPTPGSLSLLPSKYCSPVSRGSLSLLPSKYCSLDRPCLGQKQPGSRTPTLLCHGLWAASDGITAVDLKMGQLEVVSQLRSPKVGSECNALVAIIGSYSDYCN